MKIGKIVDLPRIIYTFSKIHTNGYVFIIDKKEGLLSTQNSGRSDLLLLFFQMVVKVYIRIFLCLLKIVEHEVLIGIFFHKANFFLF